MNNAASKTNGAHEPQRPAITAERQIGPDERLITLTEATKVLPKVNSKRPAVCTLWRWCRKGLRGEYLEYVRVGRKICTTHEALLRFFTKLAEIDDRMEFDGRSEHPFLKRKPITSKQRQRALAEADAILEEAGI